jgi:hypothetical protein
VKVISGGQTGADRGGLDAAIGLGLDHGGWRPKGFRAEDGAISAKYRLTETRSRGYGERTGANVREGDVTLIFDGGGGLTGGSRLTAEICRRRSKPFMVVVVPVDRRRFRKLTAFLERHRPGVINVAGNRESKCPGIQEAVRRIMTAVLSDAASGR